MLVKFEQNRRPYVVQSTRNFELFDKKKGEEFEAIFDKALTPF